MKISENLSNSFAYAKKLFSDVGRLIILIILDIIPLVDWIVVGYAARVLRETPATDAPPKLEKYGELFVDGAKVFFATLIYMLIPFALILAGAVSLMGGLQTLPGGIVTPLVLAGGVALALLVLGVILAIILLIMLGVGLAHMLKTGKFGKAFAFGEILSIIKSIGWGKYLSWIAIVVVISLVVGGLTGLIPLVGWLISIVISPILSVFIFRSLGLLYNEGAPAELRTQPPVAVAGLVCASCGTPLQPNHKFCPTCGAAAPSPPPPPPPQPTIEATKFCTSCGAKIPASAKFCGNCGSKQT